MTVIGPYRLLRTLGGCEAGEVWSAFAADGTSVTVALIEPALAADPRRLNALMSGADGLARAGVLSVVGADLSPPQPWVACAWDEGIGAGRLFTAGGMTYQLTTPGGQAFPPEPVPAYRHAVPTQPVAQSPAQPFAPPSSQLFAPPSSQPAPNGALVDEDEPTVGQAQVVPQPAFPPDAPTADLAPTPAAGPGAALPAPPLAPSQVLPEFALPPGPAPGQAPTRPVAPTPPAKPEKPAKEPRRRRRGRAVLITLLVLLLIGGGGAFAVWRYAPLDKLLGQGTPAPTATTSRPTPLAGPGIEPPVAGDWPASWATFADTDQVKAMTLDGAGFTFRVPATWKCSKTLGDSSGVNYACGAEPAIGGQFEVHTCDDGCDADQRERLRLTKDAWGLQWTRAGAYVTWAQTSALPAPNQYGLIVIGYWRNKPEGPINRQVVLRLTAPPNQAADLQKVANDVFAKIS